MIETRFLRRIVLAGALALSMTGVSAAVGGAEAMPIASPAASQADSGDVVAVRYVYRRYYRHRRAGLYNCGRANLRTHLARRACGTIAPSRRYLYRR